MKIRPYQDPDRDAVITLWREVLPDTQPHNDPVTSLDNKLVMDDSLLYVAEKDGRIVGTIMGGYDGHRGWIYSLGVLPEYRNKGVASQLVKEMVTELKVRGCQKVNLQVRKSNTEVAAFYEKCGFKVEDIISMGMKLY